MTNKISLVEFWTKNVSEHYVQTKKSESYGKKLFIDTRVDRWFVFKPKIPVLVKFGGPWNGKCCYTL
jgi:hypothetical protein